jgi:predicted nuclease with TOPRIM domain
VVAAVATPILSRAVSPAPTQLEAAAPRRLLGAAVAIDVSSLYAPTTSIPASRTLSAADLVGDADRTARHNKHNAFVSVGAYDGTDMQDG